MYLYVAFFRKDLLSRGRFYLSGEYLESFKQVFPNYQDLNETSIKGCIGFLKGKDNRQKKCLVLNVRNIKVDKSSLSFDFDVEKELDITNEFIDKSLYKFAKQSSWINKERQFYPIACVVEKTDFDIIRKGTPNIRKVSSYTAKIEQLRSKDDWIGISSIYHPLEKVHEREDIWNNVSDLYNLAFACSKQGEPKNGMEKDKAHLAEVKRYRDLSIVFFKRCCKLEQNDFRYPSSLGYRHYQNVMELSKPKGRRDGKVVEEIAEAIVWLDEAISLNPNSIKDNYRKGKLILNKQIDNFIFTQKEWTTDTFSELKNMEEPAIECLNKSIKQYENNITGEQKKRYFNEYVKALYCLGCYYSKKSKVIWNEYACSKLLQVNYYNKMTREEMGYMVKAKDILEKCFEVESGVSLRVELDFIELANSAKDPVISLMDKLYQLGLIYLKMYFVRLTRDKTKEKTIELYRKKAEAYLTAAKVIGDQYRKMRISNRNTSFISEKLAWYYILNSNYNKAISLIENCRDSYAKNTYALALMLSDKVDKYQKAEIALSSAAADIYNKTKDITTALKAYLYKLSGQEEKHKSIVLNKKENLSKSGKRLLSMLEAKRIL